MGVWRPRGGEAHKGEEEKKRRWMEMKKERRGRRKRKKGVQVRAH